MLPPSPKRRSTVYVKSVVLVSPVVLPVPLVPGPVDGSLPFFPPPLGVVPVVVSVLVPLEPVVEPVLEPVVEPVVEVAVTDTEAVGSNGSRGLKVWSLDSVGPFSGSLSTTAAAEAVVVVVGAGGGVVSSLPLARPSGRATMPASSRLARGASFFSRRSSQRSRKKTLIAHLPSPAERCSS